jgi:hypothetical protein
VIDVGDNAEVPDVFQRDIADVLLVFWVHKVLW